MSMIEAYIDPQEPEEKQDSGLEELGTNHYKALAEKLDVTLAEQSIINEIVGVEEVDEDGEEDEREELEQERQMKTLFESLYEIDEETKEVFVKGSAYDLKKWDEDMICFTFGDPERQVALEAAIHPEERYLSRAFDILQTKRSALTNMIDRHNATLSAKTVSRDFAEDFRKVMGFPIPNIRMESFTQEPSGTNYAVAMEEMTGAQMAMAAGGALVGIGLVYKMIQWFTKMLNKNGTATNSISQNIKEIGERRERLKNAGYRLQISKEELHKTLDAIETEYNNIKVKNADKAISKLKGAFESGDAAQVFDVLSDIHLNRTLADGFTPFVKIMVEGKLGKDWWEKLETLADRATKEQIKLGGYIREIAAADKLPENKPNPVDFSFLGVLKDILAPFGINEGFVQYSRDQDNAQSAMESFVSAYQFIFTPTGGEPEFIYGSEGLENSFANISINAFTRFTPEYMDTLAQVGKEIESELNRSHNANENDVKNKTNNQDLDSKRERLNALVREFKAISNLLRFVIAVRNQLGRLAIATGHATDKSEGRIKGLLGRQKKLGTSNK